MSNKRRFKILSLVLAIVNIFSIIPAFSSAILEETIIESDEFEKNENLINEPLEELEEELENSLEINIEEDEEDQEEIIEDKTDRIIKLIDIKNDKLIGERKLKDKKIAYAYDIEDYILISKDFYKIDDEDEEIKFYYYPRIDSENIEYTIEKHIMIVEGKEIEIKDKDFRINLKGIEIFQENLLNNELIDREEIQEGNLTKIINRYNPDFKMSNTFNKLDFNRNIKIPTKTAYLKLVTNEGENILTKEMAEEMYLEIIDEDINNLEDFDKMFKESDEEGFYKIKYLEEISNDSDPVKFSVYGDLFIYNNTIQNYLLEEDYKLITPNPQEINLSDGDDNLLEFVFGKESKYRIKYLEEGENLNLAPEKIGRTVLNKNQLEEKIVTAKVIPGYIPIKMKDKFKYDEESGEWQIEFNYKKRNERFKEKGYYYIKYLNQDESVYETELIIRDEKINKVNPEIVNIDELVKEKENGPKGLHRLKDYESEKILENNGEDIIIPYELIKGKANIHHIDKKTGLPIAKSDVIKGDIGSKIEIEYKENKDFNKIQMSESDIKFSKEEQDIIVLYERKTKDDEEITIYFLDDYNHRLMLKDPKTVKLNDFKINDFLDRNSVIDYKTNDDREFKYYLKNKEEWENKEYNFKDQRIILRYGRKINIKSDHRNIRNNNSIKNINNKNPEFDENPKEEPYVYQGEFGNYKHIDSDEYLSVLPREQIFPVIDSEDIIFNYLTREERELYKYIISFKDLNNNKISQDILGESNQEKINIYAREILGYELNKDENREVNLDLDLDNRTEYTFRYKKKIEKPSYILRFREIEKDDKGNIKIHNNLAEDKIILMDSLSKKINISQKDLEYFERELGIDKKISLMYKRHTDLDELKDIKIEEKGQVINIDYEKTKSKAIVYNLKMPNGEALLEPEIKYLDIGDSKILKSKDIKGYDVLDRELVENGEINIDKIPRTDQNYIFWYKKDSYKDDEKTLMINHIDRYDRRALVKSEIIKEGETTGKWEANPNPDIINSDLGIYEPVSKESIIIDFKEDFVESDENLKSINFYYDRIIDYEIAYYDKDTFEKINKFDYKKNIKSNLPVIERAKTIDDYTALKPIEQKLLLEITDPIQRIVFKYKKDIEEVDPEPEPENPGGGIDPDPEPEPEPEPKPEPERPDWGGKLPPNIDLDDLEPEIISKELNYTDHFNYIIGYPDETIRPENNVSREEVATMLLRIMNKDFIEAVNTTEHEYNDLVEGGWSERYIATMSRINIVKGYKDGSFRPRAEITRAELAVLVLRLNNLSEDELEESDSVFSDVEGHWAEDAINLVAEEGWVEGYEDGSFRPEDSIKRSELVTIINKMLDRHTKIENMLDGRKEYKDLEKFRWYYEAMQEAITPHEYYIDEETGEEVWTKIYEEVQDVFGVVTYKHDK